MLTPTSLSIRNLASRTLVTSLLIATAGVASAQTLPQQPFAWGGDAYRSQLNVLSKVQYVSVGTNHSLALTNSGEVLQFGTTTVPGVPNLLDPRWVAAGNDFSLAITSEGKIVGWGGNAQNKGITDIPVLLTGFSTVAAGTQNGAAIREDGTFTIWGKNNFGEVSGLPYGLTKVEQITIGADFMVAVDLDGKLWAWGRNQQSNRMVTTSLPTGSDFVTANASPSGNHVVALRQDGTVVAWGANASGQCDVPANLTDPFHPQFKRAKRAVAGDAHSAALLEDGSVVVWGSNLNGQLNTPAGLPVMGQLYAGGRMTVGLTPRQRGMVTFDRQIVTGGSRDTLAATVTLDSPARQDLVLRVQANSNAVQVPNRVTIAAG